MRDPSTRHIQLPQRLCIYESDGHTRPCLSTIYRHRMATLRLIACLLLTICVSVSLSSLVTIPAHAQGSVSPTATGQPAPDSKLRADLNRILQQQEFQPDTPTKTQFSNRVKDFFAMVHKRWDELGQWLRKLFAVSAGTGGNILMTCTLVGILLCFLFGIVYRLARNDTRGSVGIPIPPLSRSTEEEALPDIVRDLDFWEKEAANWEAKADYRQALRARFIQLLLTLDGADLISYHRARTTGDYLRDLHTRAAEEKQPDPRPRLVHELIRDLEPLAHTFDQIWYGPTEITAAEYTPLKATVKHTIKQVANSERANSREQESERIKEEAIEQAIEQRGDKL